MLDHFHSKIHIDIRPVEMPWGWLFDIPQVFDRLIPEPREIGVGYKQLPPMDHNRYAIGGDIGNFNL